VAAYLLKARWANFTRNSKSRKKLPTSNYRVGWFGLARDSCTTALRTKKPAPGFASPVNLSNFVSGLKAKSNYDDLIYVRNEDTDLNIMIREGSNGRLKELLVVGNDDGETIFLSAKTRLRMKDINEVLDHYLKELGWKEKAKAKKLPQA
jgi:Domain of unknown function (DUF4252)